ncbi:hypothetical protein ANN_17618 [Periplaneta americana]|uniref:Uncharacterized protein n=1 Tax=Periplaneta americana TaxID=6978 RepID=A0ABQ8STG5_PERAM|nr:hypothetical protein ANN_17618 [Periplaneta americana]
MDLREVGYDDRDWINLAQDRDRWRAYMEDLAENSSFAGFEFLLGPACKGCQQIRQTPGVWESIDQEIQRTWCCGSLTGVDCLMKRHRPQGAFITDYGRYTGQTIPDESTLRKDYLEGCYENTIEGIRNCVGNKKIYGSIDDTSDQDGRSVANVVIGTLEVDTSPKIFFLTTEVLEKEKSLCKQNNLKTMALQPMKGQDRPRPHAEAKVDVHPTRMERLETLDSRPGVAGGGVKLTRKASETRLAAPGEEVALPYSPYLWFRSGSIRGALTIACMSLRAFFLIRAAK